MRTRISLAVAVLAAAFLVPVMAAPAHATGLVPQARDGDWDGDGKTDAMIFRPADLPAGGTWYLWPTGGQPSTPVTNWGLPQDVPVVADYNSDGKADRMVFRPTDGTWTLALTGGGGGNWQFGQRGDVPVRGDYNSDGKADKMIWRSSTGTWHAFYTNGGIEDFQPWGVFGDIPVPGDYNGDGRSDRALWRPSTGTWYIDYMGGPPTVFTWGVSGDVPVPGDYNGDNISDMALWRPSTGAWYVAYSFGGTATLRTAWGLPGDTAVPGDFNGDNKSDMALWRPSTGTWYVAYTDGVDSTLHPAWGVEGDIPVPTTTTASRPPRTSGLDKPVYFIHGYSDTGSGFYARTAYWNEAITHYFTHGLQKAVVWCYYNGDQDCDYKYDGNRNTSLRTLGYLLAWHIFDNYSRKGLSVDVLAHSMGGLIIRRALTEVQLHNPSYPPYLYVEDATTLDTPHRGTTWGEACFDAQLWLQCVEMAPLNSFPPEDFLAELNDNPQSAIGTDWTVIGSDDDGTVLTGSAVPENMNSVSHRVIYLGGQLGLSIFAHMEILERFDGQYRLIFCDFSNTACRTHGRADFVVENAGPAPIDMARKSSEFASLY